MSKGFTIAQIEKPMSIEEYRSLPKKKMKYGNKKAEVDGIVFDSRKEADRYTDLKLMEKAGKIHNLQLQTVFPLTVGGNLICKYKCDFDYVENGIKVVEDVKGMKTPVYRLKAKLFEAIYGYKILET